MRNAAYVILALGGYAFLAFGGISLELGNDYLFFHLYLTWLPFGAFIWWRLSRFATRRLPRSLLFGAIFSPSLFGIYVTTPVIVSLLLIIYYSIADPWVLSLGNLSLGDATLWLALTLLPFLMIWIGAFAVMSIWPARRKPTLPDPIDENIRSPMTAEKKKDQALIAGLTVLVVVLIGFSLAMLSEREQATHDFESAEVLLTAIAAQEARTRGHYALSFSSAGTGPVTIPAGGLQLFLFQPSELAQPIDFVKSLTLHLTSAETTRTGPTTLDLTLWDFESDFGFKLMDTQLTWGENSIEIRRPDAYVSRAGWIYLEVRNFGEGEDVGLADLNFTLIVLNDDGTETIYAPTQ